MAVQAPELEAQLPAEAAGLIEGSDRMAPVVAIGGLLSVKTLWRFYGPLLAEPEGSSDLSAAERFTAIPQKGLGDFDEMYKGIEERVLGIQERIGERVMMVCQSLGSVFATEFGADHPDKVAGVISLAGLPAGIRGETPAAKALKRALGNPANAGVLQADSELMIEHKEKIASEWSPDTSLHLVSPTTDVLVPIDQGLDLALPEGQQPDKRVVVPYGIPLFVMRRFFGMPADAEALRSVLAADHVSIAINPSVIAYTRRLRREAVGNMESTAVDLSASSPELALAAA